MGVFAVGTFICAIAPAFYIILIGRVVQAIGAGAVNQAMKALVLAVGYLRGDGIEITCVPEFADVDIDGKVRTAIKLVIDPR